MSDDPAHGFFDDERAARARRPARSVHPVRLVLAGAVVVLVAVVLVPTRDELLYHLRAPPPVDLGAVLRDVLALVSNDLRECDIEAHLQLASDLPRVDGIADKLKQVFLNLVLNARDAMPKGGRLDIRGHCDGATIAVSVTDTGTGIPREHLPKIFDAFFTTKGKVSGVGLGLSVVYGIVSLHGGSITVESEPGAGTTFTITLPVTQRAAA